MATTETMTPAKTKTKTLSPRRNFQSIVTDLQKFCEISIAVMEAIIEPRRDDDGKPHLSMNEAVPHHLDNLFMEGQIAALRSVQARLEGGK